MTVTGIIAEFNPFHKGHVYIGERAREETNAELLIALISGNFVQRGEPAVFDMSVRAEAALNGGYDMVFELPPSISSASAEAFARGGVSLLSSLGTDCLYFGSETGEILPLSQIANILCKEEPLYRETLSAGLKKGLSFPAAREAAVNRVLKEESGGISHDLQDILQNPNDILAVEYLKALKKTGSKMKAHTSKRINSAYHAERGDSVLYSAEGIRNALTGITLEERIITDDHPFKEYAEAAESCGALTADSMTVPLLFTLLSDELTEKLDNAGIPEDLSNRIIKNRDFTGTFSEFCSLLKTRNITYTSVSRHLLHLILDLRPFNGKCPEYIRLLGFRKDKTGYLSELKKRSSLKILTNSSDIKNYLKEHPDDRDLSAHLRIDRSYELLRDHKKRKEHPLPPEISREIIII